MELSSDTLALLFVLVLIIVIIAVFIRISLRIRRGGGSLATLISGATDEFLTKDKRKAAETTANQNAGKFVQKTTTGDPPIPDPPVPLEEP